MTDDLLRSLVLQREGERLLHTYQRLVDARDVQGLADLVTDDVLLSRQGEEQRGREAFVDLYRRFAASDVDVAQHMATNVEVTELGTGGEGPVRIDSCFWVITTHRSGEARQVWGRYSDDMVRVDGRWLLSAKRIALVRTAFVEPSALAPADMTSFGPRPD
ncbi:nuclear transport factor 2 family protein [Nocardioides houyundeii]|uniref:nuclear transport factor 2 family protein n=1 Tax=Nocardioides houyundeii TaxID=2045452 RepID=UPI000DF4C7B9|nr:nuclear transport factor 2 family protein [Nocardioides houyundeii]